MTDPSRTNQELLEENVLLKQKIQELKQFESDRKRAEEARQKSEELYRTFINANSDMVFLKDEQLRNIVINKSLASFFCKPEGEIIGKSDFDLMPQLAAEKCKQTDMEALTSKSIVTSEEIIGDQVYETQKFPVDLGSNRTGVGGFIRNITARKRAEENFRRSNDESPLGVCIVNAESETIYVNRAILDIYGFDSIDEFKAAPAIQRYTSESFNEHQIRREKRKRGDHLPYEYEISIVKKDGEVRHLQVFRKEILWDGERQFQAIYQDITERKEAEEGLRESEGKYRILVENAGESIFIAQEGMLRFANAKTEELFGYTKEELTSRSFVDFIHPDDRSLVLDRHIKRQQGMEVPSEYSFRLINRSGDILWVELNVVLVEWNKKPATLNFMSDITIRRQAEEALKKSERTLSDIIEFLPDATLVIDLEGKVIAWNLAMEKMTGVKKEDMIGQGDHAYTIPFYGERRRHLMDLIDVSDKDFESKYQYVHRKGNILYTEAFTQALYSGKGAYVFATAAPLFDNLGNRIGAIESIRDITARRRAEEELLLSERRETILNRIARIFLTVPDEDMYREVLDVVLQEMESRFGIFGYIGENGDLIIPSMTKDIWDKCHVSDKSIVFSTDIWGESLWGRAIREKKSFVSDGPFHLPEGHAHIDNFIAVPIIFGKETIGLISFANKEGGYTGKDKDMLGGIVTHISPILNARLQRDIQERERRQAVEGLIENQRHLADIIEFLPDATLVIDKDGKVIAWNRAIETMTGIKKEDMIGKGNYEYSLPFYGDRRPILIDLALHPDKEMEKQYTAIQRVGDILFGESFTPNLPPGDIHLSATASVLRDSKGEIIAAIECIRDNTERKRLEERLNRAEKMEGLGRLAGGVAHDLNNVLGVLVGYSELACGKTA